MTITTTASETYDQQRLDPAAESAVESSPCGPLSCPKLFWAGAALFAANLFVVGGILLSPDLRVGLYGAELPSARTVSVDKPSPFTQVVDTEKPRKVKLAQRVTPVLYQEPVAAEMAPAELNIPRASQAVAATTVSTSPSSTTLRGEAVYRQVESYGEFRRVTAMSRELAPPTPRRVTN